MTDGERVSVGGRGQMGPALRRSPVGRGPDHVGSRRAQVALRGLLPYPQYHRRLTQRLGQFRNLSLALLLRCWTKVGQAAKAVLSASRKSSFHRPVFYSLTFSVRATPRWSSPSWHDLHDEYLAQQV